MKKKPEKLFRVNYCPEDDTFRLEYKCDGYEDWQFECSYKCFSISEGTEPEMIHFSLLVRMNRFLDMGYTMVH